MLLAIATLSGCRPYVRLPLDQYCAVRAAQLSAYADHTASSDSLFRALRVRSAADNVTLRRAGAGVRCTALTY